MRRLILGFLLAAATAPALADDAPDGAAAETREEQAIRWALSYRPVDDGVRKLVDEALAAADPVSREALLLRIGEPARRVLLRRALDDPKLLPILARMQPIEDE